MSHVLSYYTMCSHDHPKARELSNLLVNEFLISIPSVKILESVMVLSLLTQWLSLTMKVQDGMLTHLTVNSPSGPRFLKCK